MLMAGLDGIRNQIDPGEPSEKDLYGLSNEELKEIPALSRNLLEAIESLEEDHDFLLEDDVFSEDQIFAYLDLKREEVGRYMTSPHPVEFDLYYSL